jgi:integral membrane sensor domain MASE1
MKIWKKYQDLILAFLACMLGLALATAVVCGALHIALGNPDLTKKCALILGGGGMGVLAVTALLVVLGIWLRKGTEKRR